MNEDAPRNVLDWNAALAQHEVGETVLREVAALVIDESARMLAEIRVAKTSGDLTALRHAAHTLKGSAAAMAAQPAAEAALSLETIAKEKRVNEIEAACATVERKFQQLCLALAAQLADRKGANL